MKGLRDWILKLGIVGSEPQGGSKINSAFHRSEVNQESIRNLVVKNTDLTTLYKVLTFGHILPKTYGKLIRRI